MTTRQALRLTAILSASALLVGLVLAAVPASAVLPTLRICSANIQHTPDMPDWKVRADASEVRSHCDLVMWQEIRERADHAAIQSRGWRSTPYGKGGVPVSWRTSRLAKVSAAHIVRVSGPTPRCADGSPSYNPARYIGWVNLRARATGRVFQAVSLHFPQRHTCHDADSRQRWSDAYHATKRELGSRAVVVGGDWNRREPEIADMIRGQHWISPASRSLDHTFIAGSGFRVLKRFQRNLYSDHHLSGSRVRL